MSDQLAVKEAVSDVVEIKVLCAGCEEDFAMPGDRFCRPCGFLHEALEEQYAARPKQPRTNVGVVPIRHLMRPAAPPKPSQFRRLERYEVYTVYGLIGFFYGAIVMGAIWIVVRQFVEFGS